MRLTFTRFSESTTLTDVELVETTGNFVLPSSISQSVESVWNKLLTTQPSLHASPLYRVGEIGESNIQVQPDITYKELVGIRNTTNFQDHFDSIPYTLSLILFVHTSDDHVLLIERTTGDWPVSLELPGAFMRPADGPDLQKQTHILVKGDLGLDPIHTDECLALGVMQNPFICEQMIVAQIKLTTTLKEVQHMAPKPVFAIPTEYTTANHAEHFSVPLHIPSKQVLEEVGGY